MLVSIIVPVYNVEKYLSNCIDSLLKQSFKDFEVILIDDGSKDRSGKICDKYALKDSRIVVVHKENEGQSVARNLGISLSRGQYLVFVDSDDFVLPHFLDILYTECKKNDADMVTCGYERCSDDKTLLMINDSTSYKSECFSFNKMDIYMKTKKILNTVWGKMYKKTLFKDFVFPIRKYCEDVYSTYTLVHQCNRIVCTDYKGYIYRQNPSSVMYEKYSPQRKDIFFLHNEKRKFIEKNYPHLAKYAHIAVIYACNQVLFSMGNSLIYESDFLKEMQHYYRKYLLSYLLSKSTLHGKLFALVSFVSIRMGWFLARFI